MQPLEVFYKKVFLKISRPEACNFIQEEALVQVFSYEFCKIFKNIFLTKHLWTIASVLFFCRNKEEWDNKLFCCFSKRKLVDYKDLKQVFKSLLVIFAMESVEILICYKLMTVRRKFEHVNSFLLLLFNVSVNVGHMIECGIITKTFCLQYLKENCEYFLSFIIMANTKSTG